VTEGFEMKKNLSTLIIVMIAICLVSYSIGLNHTSSTVLAASETYPVLKSTSHTESEALSLPQSAQLAVIVVVGLVCGLFGILAVSPLLIDKAARP
jgi:hypothetical protein